MNGLIHGYVGLYGYSITFCPPINGVTYGPLLLTGSFIALQTAFGVVEGAHAPRWLKLLVVFLGGAAIALGGKYIKTVRSTTNTPPKNQHRSRKLVFCGCVSLFSRDASFRFHCSFFRACNASPEKSSGLVSPIFGP